jgi:hypothetical protein
LLHEVDLPKGEVLIGRSASCQLTIDDPLISRNHARLILRDDEATIEDLGSRNGVRVNGRPITGPTPVGDGARLRIGTQEVILRKLQEVSQVPRRHRATGFMIHCTSCGLPYSTESHACPHCGHSDQAKELPGDEHTTTTEQAWSLELLVETMKRADALGRSQDLERLLVQARDMMTSVHLTIDRRRLDQLADAAMRLAVDEGKLEWARWALGLYAKRGLVPRPEIGRRLTSLPPTTRDSLAPAVDHVVASIRSDYLADGADEQTLELLRSFSSGAGRA